jgi:hypothetical protein
MRFVSVSPDDGCISRNMLRHCTTTVKYERVVWYIVVFDGKNKIHIWVQLEGTSQAAGCSEVLITAVSRTEGHSMNRS